jgi:hypothetical protein
MPSLTPGKSLLTLVNTITLLGPYLADWKYHNYPPSPKRTQVRLTRKSETHIFNPTWPPHARYHNGQTVRLVSSPPPPHLLTTVDVARSLHGVDYDLCFILHLTYPLFLRCKQSAAAHPSKLGPSASESRLPQQSKRNPIPRRGMDRSRVRYGEAPTVWFSCACSGSVVWVVC